ncbi:MAG: TerC family protein, partial [Myxococcota bacterium]
TPLFTVIVGPAAASWFEFRWGGGGGIGQEISGRDLVLLLGGGFLIFKSSSEIFEKVENVEGEEQDAKGGKASFLSVIVQIMIIDIVFSLDSVITAVGMADELWVMATAMIAAVLVMMLFAQSVGEFVNRHPSLQVLALSFLLLIGVLLVAESFDQHVSKGYVYFAMGFSLLVEMVNMRRRSKVEAKTKEEPGERDREEASLKAGR